MGKIIATIGFIFLLLLGIKIIAGTSTDIFWLNSHQFNDPAFSEKANTIFAQAYKVREEIAADYKNLKRWAFYIGLLGLLFTSIATIMAGFARAAGKNKSEEFLNTKLTGIGLLCALASVANLTYDRVYSTAEDKKESLNLIQEVITDVQAELKVSQVNEARLLDDLTFQIKLEN